MASTKYLLSIKFSYSVVLPYTFNLSIEYCSIKECSRYPFDGSLVNHDSLNILN